jgi:hypothetical protein
MDNQRTFSDETRRQMHQLMKRLISAPRATPAWTSVLTSISDYLVEDAVHSFTDNMPQYAPPLVTSSDPHTTTQSTPIQQELLHICRSDVDGIKDLKPNSSLAILAYLNDDPCNFFHRDDLVKAVHDVIPDMTMMGAQKMVRTLLADSSIETKMDDFFRITSVGMERLRKEKAVWNCKHGRWNASIAKAKQHSG